jgi:flagellar motor component MotA
MDIGTLIGIIGGTAILLTAILLKAGLENFIDPAGILILIFDSLNFTLL